MLLSGRYLGVKWGVREFRETMERLILEKGLLSDVRALPDVNDFATIENPQRFSIMDFNNLFHFSHARWN